MSAQIIRFPTWQAGKQTIDTEEEMVAWMIKTQCPNPYSRPKQAAEIGKLVWREFQRRGLVETRRS